MAAFPEEYFETKMRNYLRKLAIKTGCNPNIDNRVTSEDLRAMNEKGDDGRPGCNCKLSKCPCKELKMDLDTMGHCYCEILWRV